MKLFRDVLKRNIPALLLLLIVTVGDLAVFLLYGLILEPFLYATALSFFCAALLLLAGYLKAKKKAAALEYALRAGGAPDCLPPADSLAEEDYRKMIVLLDGRLKELAASFDAERQDALDYYTSWVHQIKTPIAVMKLKLRDDTPEDRALAAELFRIEQYVDMVLQYIRLGSSTNDLVIREYSLDELIRETVRKYASQFVEKKLEFRYTPAEATIVTDKKWFSCILEQFISNAVKYTPAGAVTVSVTEDALTVSDTGIGIAPEDLPRIFEKGYTGSNGRIGERSSGLGLYLARKAAELLNLALSAESVPGEGSRFTIRLKR